MTAVLARPDRQLVVAHLKQCASEAQVAAENGERRAHALNNLGAAITLMSGGKRHDQFRATTARRCQWRPTVSQIVMLTDAAQVFETETDKLDTCEAAWQALLMGLAAECWLLVGSAKAEETAQRCLTLTESLADTCGEALDALLEGRVGNCLAVLGRHAFKSTDRDTLNTIGLLLPAV